MFHIKVCGITSAQDAQAVVAAGADAVGLNFYPRSVRYVEPGLARDVRQAIPAGVLAVGLFVDAPAEAVCRTFDELDLGLVQLHGDEPPDYLLQLGDRPVMKAFRVSANGLAPVRQYLCRCQELGHPPQLVLFDSMVAGAYGGSGMTGDWDAAAEYVRNGGGPPLVLAGGLNPDNVEQAIRVVGATAVDTASGVENAPGRKSSTKTVAFVKAARRGFNSRRA